MNKEFKLDYAVNFAKDNDSVMNIRFDNPAMEVENLSVSYKGKKALDNVSVAFEREKMTGIIGPNGAGKSTMIKAMLGLVDGTYDDVVRIDGLPLNEQRRKIAYVEQRSELDLTFPICVEEVVMLGRYPLMGLFKRPKKEDKDIVRNALKTVEMEDFRNRQIGELSGGQLQRVFIARALAQQADIYLLDEPFVGIDAVSEALIMKVLKQLKSEGKTIIIVHHDLHKVESYFDNLVILNRELVASGAVEDVFTGEFISNAYGENMGQLLFGKGK